MNKQNRVATYARLITVTITTLAGLASFSACGGGSEGEPLAPTNPDAGISDSGLPDAQPDAGIEGCEPDDTKPCVCTDGADGIQQCNDERAWDACICLRSDAGVSDTGMIDGGNAVCVEGDSKACTCTDGRPGAQACNSNRTWNDCVCTGSLPDVCIATALEADCGAICVDPSNNNRAVCLWSPADICKALEPWCTTDGDNDGLTDEEGDCNDSNSNIGWCEASQQYSETALPLCRDTDWVPDDPTNQTNGC